MWEPGRILDFGRTLEFRLSYKLYPSCRFCSALDCVQELLDTHHFKPQEITSIDAFSLLYAHRSVQCDYADRYPVFVPVCGDPNGVRRNPGGWRDANHINNEEYQAYEADRIHGDPRAGEEEEDPASWYARVRWW